MQFSVELTSPCPVALNPGNWGFIVKGETFGTHDHNWFSTKSDFICYICLASTEYLTCENEHQEKKQAIEVVNKRIQRLLGPALEANIEGGVSLSETIDQLGNYFGEIKQLIWWGQFQDLIAGRRKVETEIREEYFAKNRLPRTKEVSNIEDFAAWIYGEFGAHEATGS